MIHLRPMREVDGVPYYRCRDPICTRSGQWLHEEEFYPLPNPQSRCKRQSVCKRCSIRHRTQKKRLVRERVR